MGKRLSKFIQGDPEPTDRAWAELGLALWRGDPLADDVMDWIQSQGVAVGWKKLEHAIEHGLGAVEESAPALSAFMQSVWTQPEWLDESKLAVGAKALQSTGLQGLMVLRDACLMAGYQASAINKTLVMTGALHRGALRRVAETTAWWLACTGDGGMAPGQLGFNATLRVRLRHALVRYQLSRSPQWDEAYLGLPINQVDMQATYLAFSTLQLMALRGTGVWLSRAEASGVMHLWRYIGWLMGVEDGLMCDDERQGRVLLYRNVVSQAPPDESSVLLGQALMDEPLARHYPWGGAWRGRFVKARHLSLVRWFVGTRGMDNLGLPRTLPWYPVLMLLPFLLRSALLLCVPGLGKLWRHWARRRQVRYMRVLTGKQARLWGLDVP